MRFQNLTLALFGPMIMFGVFGVGCKKQEVTRESRPEVKVSVYHCPMHPQIIKNAPGLCPICAMDLVRIESDPSEGRAEKYPIVQVSVDMIKTLKIRTEKVSLRDSSGVLIPAKALVRTENRRRVVVALGEGRFQPRPVEVGEESRDSIYITNGLEDGDEVVVSGQFLLDSESGLRAAASTTQAR
jgi:hypothetical protein